VPLLPVGRYSVTAEATGFKKAIQTGIVLAISHSKWARSMKASL